MTDAGRGGPPSGPWEARPSRDVIRLEGPDSRSFLQGQLSQDLSEIGRGEEAWSFLLQPNGKVEAWLRVEPLGGDDFALDVDEGWGPAVLERLERFKLRVSVALSLEPRGRLVPVPEGLDAYETARIAAGIPAMGAELTQATIPAEVGQWIIDASVSFTKGCYTGQELVARVDSRGGNVPRRLRVLDLGEGSVVQADGEPPAPGDEVALSTGEKATVTSVAPDGSVALAYVARLRSP